MEGSHDKVERLQKLEQNLQGVIVQKQTFQAQATELENALEEVTKSSENPFRVIGGIMVEVDKETLKKELESKKDVAEIRVKSFEKHEARVVEEIKELQGEVLKQLKKPGK